MINHKSSIINRKSQSAFTLIELLVVISIIGALATIFIANFMGIRERARDSQRKSNLRQIQAALELYRNTQGIYPIPGAYGLYSAANCPDSSLVAGGVTYMTKIPCDPMTPYYNGSEYYYTSPGGTSYTLCACLENANDNQGAANSTCSNGGTCSTGKFFFLESQ